MAYKDIREKNLPKHTRFPVNRPAKPHTQKHPNGYLTPILKKLLNKKMTVNDDEVKRVLEIKSGTKAELKKIIMLRYILNAIEGENTAIEGILDRMDGKVVQELKGDFKATYAKISIIRNYDKEKDARKQEGLRFNPEAD